MLAAMRPSTLVARLLLTAYGAVQDCVAGARSVWDAWRVDALHARGAKKDEATVLEISIVSRGRMKPVYAVETWWSVLCCRFLGAAFCPALPFTPSFGMVRCVKHVRLLRAGKFCGFLCTGDPADVLGEDREDSEDRAGACVWTMVSGVSTRWVPESAIRASHGLTVRDIVEYLLAADWFDREGMQRVALRREELSISFLNDDLDCCDFAEDEVVTVP